MKDVVGHVAPKRSGGTPDADTDAAEVALHAALDGPQAVVAGVSTAQLELDLAEWHVELVVDSGLDVFAQNVETVQRLTHPVRDPRAGYGQTIEVLAHAKAHRPDVLTKTSLMLGLGERDNEILKTMDDLRAANVDILTLGQYLRPTPNHLPVDRYVTPEEFEVYRQEGLEKGFIEVVAGPMVRSSYRAEQVLQKNNVGIAV